MLECKDCRAQTQAGLDLPVRKLAVDTGGKLRPGPRCVTHWRIFSKGQKARTHEKRVQKVYGLESGEYEKLHLFQGGRCAILHCTANGTSRALSVDHDHKTNKVRGLLCRPHNDMFGLVKDNPAILLSMLNYLLNPPYDRMRQRG